MVLLTEPPPPSFPVSHRQLYRSSLFCVGRQVPPGQAPGRDRPCGSLHRMYTLRYYTFRIEVHSFFVPHCGSPFIPSEGAAFYRDFRTLVSFRSALSRIEVTMSSLLLPTCRLSCGPFIAIICVSSAFPDPRAFHPGLWIALRPLQPFRGFPLAPILPRPPGPAPVCGSAVGRDPWCRDDSPMFPTLKVPVFLYSVPVTCPPGRVGPTEGLPCGAPTLLCGLAGSPARARTLYLVL